MLVRGNRNIEKWVYESVCACDLLNCGEKCVKMMVAVTGHMGHKQRTFHGLYCHLLTYTTSMTTPHPDLIEYKNEKMHKTDSLIFLSHWILILHLCIQPCSTFLTASQSNGLRLLKMCKCRQKSSVHLYTSQGWPSVANNRSADRQAPSLQEEE